MTDEAVKTFFPSLREGHEPIDDGTLDGAVTITIGGTAIERAYVQRGPVTVPVEGEEVSDSEEVEIQFHLLGPGDVTGIDSQQIVRREPAPHADAHSYRQFPLVEFDRADLPWLFSPERPNGEGNGRLRPWCCLVVVDRDAVGVTYEPVGPGNLPVLEAPSSELPDPTTTWAWAHAQRVGPPLKYDESIRADDIPDEIDPTGADTRARLVAARHLEPGHRYRACVVPVYETGRLAGLGEDPAEAMAEDGVTGDQVWDLEAAPRLPVYDSWTFATAEVGDFFKLARKLEPVGLGPGIGIRTVDVSAPGPTRLTVPGEGEESTVGLEGPLRSPAVEPDVYLLGDELAHLLNRTDSLAEDLHGTLAERLVETLLEVLNEPFDGDHAAALDDEHLQDLDDDLDGDLAENLDLALLTELVEDLESELGLDLVEDGDLDQAFIDRLVEAVEARVKVVGPPLYGRWHEGRSTIWEQTEAQDPMDSMTQTFLFNWFDQLNADPRYRLAAGFGTQIVQEDQEDLMAKAWDQFGDLDLVNKRLNSCQLMRAAFEPKFEELQSFSDGLLVRETRSIHPHVYVEPEITTVTGVLDDLPVPDSVAEPLFRQLTAPTGPLTRRPGVEIAPNAYDRLLEKGLPGWMVEEPIEEPGPGESPETTETPVSTGGPPGQEPTTYPIDEGTVYPVDDGTTYPQIDPVFEHTADSISDPLVRSELGQDVPATRFAELLDVGGPTGDDESRAVFLKRTGPARIETVDRSGETREERIARHKVLASIENLKRHCRAAAGDARELERTAKWDGDEFHALAREEGPGLARRCSSLEVNAIVPLARALSKLLVEPRPPTIADELTGDQGATGIDDLRASAATADRRTTDVLANAAKYSDPRVAVPELKQITRTLEEMIETADEFRGRIAIEPSLLGLSPEQLASEEAEPWLGAETEAETGVAPTAAYMMGGIDDIDADFGPVREAILEELNPHTQLLEVAADRTGVSREDLEARPEPLAEVMAAPTFPRPMWERLRDLGVEYLLPGVSEVPRDSVGLVETNPRFIEAFMAGLNHEMSRLLYWRRFPTDRRGTYFRHFWDHTCDPECAPGDLEATADITKMEKWTSMLGFNGTHDPSAPMVVLLIRGEVLRRYPNTIIYAAKAVSKPADDDTDRRVPAVPETTATEEAEDETLIFPSFRGKLTDDVAFIGFELDVERALYDPYHEEGEPHPADHKDEGWFFVLEEPPSDTRFGLVGGDLDESFEPIAEVGEYVDPNEDVDGFDVTHIFDADQYEEDFQEWTLPEWGRNGAHMAEITYRRPKRVAFHARDMVLDPDKGAFDSLVGIGGIDPGDSFVVHYPYRVVLGGDAADGEGSSDDDLETSFTEGPRAEPVGPGGPGQGGPSGEEPDWDRDLSAYVEENDDGGTNDGETDEDGGEGR